QGEFAYHWYTDTSSSHASFQQLTAGSDVTVNIGAITQKGLDSSSALYRILEHYCGESPANPRTVVNREKDAKERENRVPVEIKPRDRCDFGTLELKSYLTL